MPRIVAATYFVVVLAATAASTWLSARESASTGLGATLVQTDAFDGRPLLRRVLPALDLTFVDRNPSLPRRYFHVRWDGYWIADRDRLADFAAGADDRVTVRLDDRVVVDRHRAAGVDVAARGVPVAAGAHRLSVDYEQQRGGYALSVAVALDGGAFAPFDPAALFPDEPSSTAIAARARARLLGRVVLVLWIPVAAWLVVAVARRARSVRDCARRAAWWRRAAASRAAGCAVVVFGAVLLLAAALPGADYGRYRDWANAYLYQDLFLIGTPVGSPLGLPLTQWSHGPGLIFSTARLTLGPMIDVNTSAMVVGWLASLVFWWSLFRILRWAARGDVALAVLGAGAAFVGTHAGFYTHHHASEPLALALVGLLTLLVIERPDRGSVRSALVGAAAGLLLVTRSNLAMYAVPALVWQAAQLLRSDTGRARRAIDWFLLVAPVAIAAAQVGLVNRWMTGSFVQSPYTFGAGTFRSLDWADPEVGAVLFHPWHGLLPYHPLYALGFLALATLLATSRTTRARLLCLSALGPVTVNVYVQSAWYVWWMGTDTFGSRGLVVISIALVAGLMRFIALAYDRNRLYGRLLVLLVTSCSVWSYLMLRQGTSQFLTYAELVDGQRRALEAVLAGPYPFVLALVPAFLVALWLRSRRAAGTDVWVEMSAAFLGLLTFSYLLLPWLGRPWWATSRLALPAALLLVLIWTACELASHVRTGRGRPPDEELTADSLVHVGTVGMFAATAVIFMALAVATERRLATGDRPREFETTATIHTPEVVASYGEYQRVSGFEDKKRALANFLGIER